MITNSSVSVHRLITRAFSRCSSSSFSVSISSDSARMPWTGVRSCQHKKTQNGEREKTNTIKHFVCRSYIIKRRSPKRRDDAKRRCDESSLVALPRAKDSEGSASSSHSLFQSVKQERKIQPKRDDRVSQLHSLGRRAKRTSLAV